MNKNMLIMIDNYDSFTYNIVQEMGKLGAEMEVFRNDTITVEKLKTRNPIAVIISPGPCTPSQAGISIQVILTFMGKIPIFGVCLGHQALIQAFGGTIIHAKKIMHGKTSSIRHNRDPLFENVSNPFKAGRYHSLVGNPEDFPSCLKITAESDDGEIMGLRHKTFPIVGVQFHPESVLTPSGPQIMKNFLNMI